MVDMPPWQMIADNGETPVQNMAGTDFSVERRLLANRAPFQFGQNSGRVTQFHGDTLPGGASPTIKRGEGGIKFLLKVTGMLIRREFVVTAF